MRLNPDCVRDVMLYLEESLSFGDSRMFIYGNCNLEGGEYTDEEILEAVGYAVDCGFLSDSGIDNGYIINGIRKGGHDFLANTRTIGIWEEAKRQFKEKGVSGGIDILSKVAGQIIKNKFGL